MALDPKRLAPHKARPVPSIVIKASTPDGKLISLGAVKGMERRMSRNMTRRRELDSDIPGVTLEIVPGATTTFELTITRAMLYKGAMLEGFGINGIEDLIEQNTPIEIHEVRNNLDNTKQTIVYKGCYFKDNPLTIDIDGDWIIFQSAVLEVASAVVSGSKQNTNISPDNFSATASAASVPRLT